MLAEILSDPPAGVDDALALADGLDDVLVHGLGRLDETRAAAITSPAAAFTGTPLAGAVADALGKIVAGTVTDEHLAVLAGARSALTGAAHDALLAGLDASLGRTREPWTAPAVPVEPSHLTSGARAWLRELAITGWRGVDHEIAAGAAQTVQTLLAEPAYRRLAVLLDGFAAELRQCAPVAGLDLVPVRRWADLWSRAMLLAQDGFPAYAPAPVDGRLLPLGVELFEHPTAFQARMHALLETAAGEVRTVRVGVTAAKVDTISGASAWRMLSGFPIFRAVLAEHRAAVVTGMLLTPAGDLIWDESRAAVAEPADPFATARVRLATAVASSAAPLDRHPALLAEPVFLEGYAPGAEAFDLGGASLPLDLDRLPAAGPITPAQLAASTACIGLLRRDAGSWSLQPFAVQATIRKKPVVAHTADWALGPTDAKAAKAEAVAGTAVEVLRERAGKLLRK